MTVQLSPVAREVPGEEGTYLFQLKFLALDELPDPRRHEDRAGVEEDLGDFDQNSFRVTIEMFHWIPFRLGAEGPFVGGGGVNRRSLEVHSCDGRLTRPF